MMQIGQNQSLNPDLRRYDESDSEMDANVKEVDDILLQAGIPYSAQQIYQREYDLPMDNRGKYYQAQAVDDLLVMFNDIFKRLAQQAVVDHTAAQVTRETIDAFKASRKTDRNQLSAVQAELNAVQQDNQTLRQKQVKYDALVKRNRQLQAVGLQLRQLVVNQRTQVQQLEKETQRAKKDLQTQWQQTKETYQQSIHAEQTKNQQLTDAIQQQRDINAKLQMHVEELQQQLNQVKPKYQTLLYKYQQLQLTTHTHSVDKDE